MTTEVNRISKACDLLVDIRCMTIKAKERDNVAIVNGLGTIVVWFPGYGGNTRLWVG